MARRAGHGTDETDSMMEDIEAGSKMKTNTMYELMKLRDLESFISKIYWLIVLCFFAFGRIHGRKSVVVHRHFCIYSVGGAHGHVQQSRRNAYHPVVDDSVLYGLSLGLYVGTASPRY